MKEIEEELDKNLRNNLKKIPKKIKKNFLFLHKMESLQSLSARVLAKNDFNENFFHKKLMCHWEIRNAKKTRNFRSIQCL